MKPVPTKSPTKAAPTAKGVAKVAAPHQHTVPGADVEDDAPAPAVAPKAKPAIGGLKSGLLGLAAKAPVAKKGGKKDHVITLPPEFSEALSELQTVNANIKSLGARKDELQAGLYPAIEERRRALCAGLMEYIGSVKVRSGDDAGVGTYFIKHQWTGMNAADADQMAAAIQAISDALSLDAEGAEMWIAANMTNKTEVTFKEEALNDPDVIKLIQDHLGAHVDVKMTLVPTKHLADSASYDDQSAAAIDALESARLVKRYAATLKPAGKTSD